ncbi:hypothetical protein C8Q74DRAFT_1219403 [Fomes fomentarius]|nr:hypothetical protein C8Q74DRAFT_1219403 [Fomes fomentarius]
MHPSHGMGSSELPLGGQPPFPDRRYHIPAGSINANSGHAPQLKFPLYEQQHGYAPTSGFNLAQSGAQHGVPALPGTPNASGILLPYPQMPFNQALHQQTSFNPSLQVTNPSATVPPGLGPYPDPRILPYGGPQATHGTQAVGFQQAHFGIGQVPPVINQATHNPQQPPYGVGHLPPLNQYVAPHTRATHNPQQPLYGVGHLPPLPPMNQLQGIASPQSHRPPHQQYSSGIPWPPAGMPYGRLGMSVSSNYQRGQQGGMMHDPRERYTSHHSNVINLDDPQEQMTQRPSPPPARASRSLLLSYIPDGPNWHQKITTENIHAEGLRAKAIQEGNAGVTDFTPPVWIGSAPVPESVLDGQFSRGRACRFPFTDPDLEPASLSSSPGSTQQPVDQEKQRPCFPTWYHTAAGSGLPNLTVPQGVYLAPIVTSNEEKNHKPDFHNLSPQRREWWLPVRYINAEPIRHATDVDIPVPPIHPNDETRIIKEVDNRPVPMPFTTYPHPAIEIKWQVTAQWFPTKRGQKLSMSFIWCGDPGQYVVPSLPSRKGNQIRQEIRNIWIEDSELDKMRAWWRLLYWKGIARGPPGPKAS